MSHDVAIVPNGDDVNWAPGSTSIGTTSPANKPPSISFIHIIGMICVIGVFVIVVHHLENRHKVKVDDECDAMESQRDAENAEESPSSLLHFSLTETMWDSTRFAY